jgi:hypothetical protein
MILFGYYDNYIKDENGIILFKKVDGAESAYTGRSASTPKMGAEHLDMSTSVVVVFRFDKVFGGHEELQNPRHRPA